MSSSERDAIVVARCAGVNGRLYLFESDRLAFLRLCSDLLLNGFSQVGDSQVRCGLTVESIR